MPNGRLDSREGRVTRRRQSSNRHLTRRLRNFRIEIHGGFSYDERRVDDCTDLNNRCSIRYYHEAGAAIQVDKNSDSPKTCNERGGIRVRSGMRWLGVASAHRYAHARRARDDPICLKQPGMLDRLLPQSAVRSLGDVWPVAANCLPAMLSLDAVSERDVRGELVDVKDDTATVETRRDHPRGCRGALPRKCDSIGQADFDLVHHRLRNREADHSREAAPSGFVSPGLDVKAQLTIDISPLAGSDQLAEAALKEAVQMAKEEESAPQPLLLQSAGHFQLFHDRRWHTTRDDAELVVLRFVDRGELVALLQHLTAAKLAVARRRSDARRVSKSM